MRFTQLKKGKKYDWSMGAQPLQIVYLGRSSDKRAIYWKPGTSVGKGFIFQWVHNANYIELGAPTIGEYVHEIEEVKIENKRALLREKLKGIKPEDNPDTPESAIIEVMLYGLREDVDFNESNDLTNEPEHMLIHLCAYGYEAEDGGYEPGDEPIEGGEPQYDIDEYHFINFILKYKLLTFQP